MSAIYQFKTTQKIPASHSVIWDFISSPNNLSKITPPNMGFQIMNEPLVDKMYSGMIIAYKVSPLLGIPLDWVTEITHVRENEYFVDEQRIGPYAMWHHQHKITKIDEGTLMEDIVSYRPPFGYLGKIANLLFINNQLKQIFEYRHQAIEREFGKWQ